MTNGASNVVIHGYMINGDGNIAIHGYATNIVALQYMTT
jgi:hypothetical protein